MAQVYPDITAILQAKQERRLALAALSWEEKVAIIEQMQRSLPRGLWKSHAIREQALAYEVTTRPDTTMAVDVAGRTLIEVQDPPVSQTIIEERR